RGRKEQRAAPRSRAGPPAASPGAGGSGPPPPPRRRRSSCSRFAACDLSLKRAEKATSSIQTMVETFQHASLEVSEGDGPDAPRPEGFRHRPALEGIELRLVPVARHVAVDLRTPPGRRVEVDLRDTVGKAPQEPLEQRGVHVPAVVQPEREL